MLAFLAALGTVAVVPPSPARAAQHAVVAVVADGPSCALFDNGQVKCWGQNDFGQLGLEDTRTRGDGPGEMGESLLTVNLGRGRTATQVVGLGLNACALLDDGRVKCWGWGNDGVLGQGNETTRGAAPGTMGGALPAVPLGTRRTATAIAAGGRHVCALLDNGRVKCWGRNGQGQLGRGDDVDAIGDDPGEMGDALAAVDLGTGRTATAISAGQAHTCAILDNAQLKCWGSNTDGEIGFGSSEAVGDDPGEMGDALPAVNLGTGRTAAAVSAGGSTHTCAVLDNGQVKCWGINLNGELGLGDQASRGDQPGEMGDALPPVTLGTGRTALHVSAGFGSTCAILDDHSVKCWGFNDAGTLGLGDRDSRGDEPGEMGDALPAVALGTGRSAVSLDVGSFACAVLDDGSAKCWGDNEEGALGLGDVEDRGDQPGEMGDALPAVSLGSGEPFTRRVDLEIRRAGQTTWVGNDIYNATGAQQTRRTSVRRGASASFVVRLRNESPVADTLRVQGPRSSGRFTVRYFAGGLDVTPYVVAGGWRYVDWPPNGAAKLTVRITAASNAVLSSSFRVNVTLSSKSDPATKDVVSAVARVVR